MKRYLYKTNSLVEVTIQFNFPKILSLNVNEPAEFQELIRDIYPNYQCSIQSQQKVSLVINQNDANTPISSVIQRQPNKLYEFISQDGTNKVTLSSDFIALSTVKYTQWENMKSLFLHILKAFEQTYKNPFYQRIGVRYTDAFSRSKLGLENEPWDKLIQPMWLGAMSISKEENIISTGINMEYILDNNSNASKVRINAGIGSVNNGPEKVFIVNSDFMHNGAVQSSTGETILNYLHKKSTELYQNIITEKLHLAMGPTEV